MTISETKLLDPLRDVVLFLVKAAVIWKGVKPHLGGQKCWLLSSRSQTSVICITIHSSAALKFLKWIRCEICYTLSVLAVGEWSEIQTREKNAIVIAEGRRHWVIVHAHVWLQGAQSRLPRALSNLKPLKPNNLNLFYHLLCFGRLCPGCSSGKQLLPVRSWWEWSWQGLTGLSQRSTAVTRPCFCDPSKNTKQTPYRHDTEVR